jgi:hypothetical protein
MRRVATRLLSGKYDEYNWNLRERAQKIANARQKGDTIQKYLTSQKSRDPTFLNETGLYDFVQSHTHLKRNDVGKLADYGIVTRLSASDVSAGAAPQMSAMYSGKSLTLGADTTHSIPRNRWS